MNRLQRMDYLIKRLLDENPRLRATALPEDKEGKWQMLRSLMNVRPPGPVDAVFLREQDALLRDLTAEKGIVDVRDLDPLPSEPNLVLWQGDITRLRVGAIVNAANAALLGCFQPCHSCIDNVIHTYAGVQLRSACDELMRRRGGGEDVAHVPASPIAAQGPQGEPTGRAQITAAYNLPCDYVLHTVGPAIARQRVTEEDERLLASCYRSCLELAALHGIDSVAFCCIATGVFRFPKERAARIAIHTVRDHLASHPNRMKGVFNVFTEEDRVLYSRLLGAD